VSEALANAMIYGNGRDPAKRVRVEVDLAPEQVAVVVRDEGHGFDPEAWPTPPFPRTWRSPAAAASS
jgi:serine/threonine-protein kinase RsbW